MESFKSRQDWKTPKIDITPIRIRYRVTEALTYSVIHVCSMSAENVHIFELKFWLLKQLVQYNRLYLKWVNVSLMVV